MDIPSIVSVSLKGDTGSGIQCLVISDDVDPSSDQFVFPLEEGLKYGNRLVLKGAVVPLSVGKLLGQESSWAACLPIRPLSQR